MAPITAPSWHHHGTDHSTITAQSWHRSRHNYGTIMAPITAQSRHRSRHNHGTIMAQADFRFRGGPIIAKISREISRFWCFWVYFLQRRPKFREKTRNFATKTRNCDLLGISSKTRKFRVFFAKISRFFAKFSRFLFWSRYMLIVCRRYSNQISDSSGRLLFFVASCRLRLIK